MEVALSLRICCSRVCKANLKAAFPCESIDWPTNLPGIDLSRPDLTDMKPACGPPKPIGTPNLCALPTAISAPRSPGDFNRVSASKSQSTIDNAFAFLTCAMAADKSLISPVESG